MTQDLLDLDTLVAVKKAAPKVATVPFSIACYVARAMALFAKDHDPNIDENGHVYWETRVKALYEIGTFGDEVSINHVGRALKAMGLESWRKMDGYHVAFSIVQLEILSKHFKA